MSSANEVVSSRPSLAEHVQRSRLGPPIRALVSRARTLQWIRNGRPAPAPPHRKQAFVVDQVRRHRPAVFVETGTYRGDTLAKVAPLVGRAVSIELDATLAELARHRLRSKPNVEILTGDSAETLPAVVASLSAPALFWLDGHFSGGATADSGLSPILAEIGTVLSAPIEHVILIDDLRLFDGTDGYPTLDQLRDAVDQHRPGWSFEASDDIAQVHAGRR